MPSTSRGNALPAASRGARRRVSTCAGREARGRLDQAVGEQRELGERRVEIGPAREIAPSDSRELDLARRAAAPPSRPPRYGLRGRATPRASRASSGARSATRATSSRGKRLKHAEHEVADRDDPCRRGRVDVTHGRGRIRRWVAPRLVGNEAWHEQWALRPRGKSERGRLRSFTSRDLRRGLAATLARTSRRVGSRPEKRSPARGGASVQSEWDLDRITSSRPCRRGRHAASPAPYRSSAPRRSSPRWSAASPRRRSRSAARDA